MTLAQVAAGANDAHYAATFKAIAAAYPGADVRLGWEEDGEWYLWSATIAANKATDSIAAYTRVAALARVAGLRPWLCPSIGRPANAGDPGATVAPDVAFDVYLNSAWTDASDGQFVAWWMQNTLTNWQPARTKAVMEFGSTNDRAAYMAKSLAQFQGMGLEKLVIWDSDSGYTGLISDGSQPGTAIELWKVFGPAPIKAQLAGASLYTGTAVKASPPVGYTHAVLAQLANGDVEQLAWGDAVGQTLQATDLTAQAATAKAGAVPALTVTNSQGATATVVPNADGSAVIEVTFPTTAATVTYDLKLSSSRKLGFATAAGGLAGALWQAGKLFGDFTWATEGGTARVYVAPQ